MQSLTKKMGALKVQEESKDSERTSVKMSAIIDRMIEKGAIQLGDRKTYTPSRKIVVPQYVSNGRFKSAK